MISHSYDLKTSLSHIFFKWRFLVMFSKVLISNNQCSRFKSSMPFKLDLNPQNIHLLKQYFKIEPHIEKDYISWSPQYNLPATKTNKRRALSLQTVELDGWFLILHIVLKPCTMYHVNHTSLIWVLYFISILLDWRLEFEPTLQLKFDSPSKWNSYEHFNLEHR